MMVFMYGIYDCVCDCISVAERQDLSNSVIDLTMDSDEDM